MTNQKLLAWLDGFSDYLDSLDYVFSNKDSQAFSQLRAILQEPTDEERKELYSHAKGWLHSTNAMRDDCPLCQRILAFIMSSKRTVTRERIRRMVQVNWEYATATIADEATCDIWEERVVEFLAELGIEISDKGDVPVISEEGHSNEDKPFVAAEFITKGGADRRRHKQ